MPPDFRMVLATAVIFDDNSRMKTARTRKKWGFRLSAAALAVLPFLLLELALQAFGPADDQAKLSRGLKATVPLFAFDKELQQYITSLPYQQFFAEVSFSPKTATDNLSEGGPEKLIFVLGGSTVQGRPFAPKTAFPAWAECLLNDSANGSRVRVVNCGGVSFASYRLRQIVPELLTYDPDMIVIATGHNEFLEDHTYFRSTRAASRLGTVVDAIQQLKTVSLLRRIFASDAKTQTSEQVPIVNHEVKAKLDNEAGYETYHYDADWHQAVLEQFERSLEDMIGLCGKANVPVIVVELASNSRDCAPFKSEHAPTVSEQSRAAWVESMEEAEKAIDLEKWDSAIPFLQKAIECSPEYALAHFRLARCFRATQDIPRAKQHYQLAVDHDVCPLRMKSTLHQSLRDICDQHSIPRLDCNDVLSDLSGDKSGTFGFELFLDHVHPTVRAHQGIGRKLAELIHQNGISLDNQQQNDTATIEVRFREKIEGLPTTYFANGRRRIGWLEKWARAQKTSSEVIPMTVTDVVQRIRRRLELRDTDYALELHAALSNCPETPPLLWQLHEEFLQSGQSQPAEVLKASLINEADSGDNKRDKSAPVSDQKNANGLLPNVTRAHVREILDRVEAE